MANHSEKKILNNLRSFANATAHTVTAKAQNFFNNAQSAKDATAEHVSREDEITNAMEKLRDNGGSSFFNELGESPVPLTEEIIRKIKALFPIPREQCILWADAEFDLRPSGIVCTENGVFIKNRVAIFAKKEADGDGEKERSALWYYRWAEFDPACFTAETVSENNALSTAPECSERFVSVCRRVSSQNVADDSTLTEFNLENGDIWETVSKTAATSGSSVYSATHGIFLEQNSALNNPSGGHGNLVEEYLTLQDRLHGEHATLIGNDGVKNGADRIVNGSYIQTKYCKTATKTVDACFNGEGGSYQYVLDGKPMQLEVPRDQYEQVVAKFRNKIESGKVPGVSDPNEAEAIVKRGRLSYDQAVNLAKPGTVESLTYDALTGIVTCSCAFGITFVATAFLSWRQNGDIKQAIRDGAYAGVQVFGISFVQHMLISQLSRMSLIDALAWQSSLMIGVGGTANPAYTALLNAIRATCGNGALSLSGATKIFHKILRSNVFTTAVTVAVFSIPETYKLSMHKISKAQYAKNLTVLAGTAAGGAGGACGALAAAKIAGIAGTAVAPGIGTVIGIAGGFVGGAIGAKAVSAVGGIIREDDITVLSRMFNAITFCMTGEYMFDSNEMDKLVEKINALSQKEFKSFFETLQASGQQEKTVRDFLIPYFDAVAKARPKFLLPPSETITESLADYIETENE